MLNKCILIGRLTKAPELRYTDSGTAVANFSLAVERKFKNSQGKRDVDFIEIVVWRKMAVSCAEHLGKGRKVAVVGRLQVRKNIGNDGRNYINPEIVANEVNFLDWPDDEREVHSPHKEQAQNQRQHATQTAEINDDDFDVPF